MLFTKNHKNIYPHEKILFVLLLSFNLSASAKNCENEDSMGAIRACLESQSPEPVDTAYNHLIKVLRNNNEAIEAIKKAQSDWQNFRDSTCDYIAITYKGNGYSDDERANCLADFSNARVKILNKYINTAK